MTWVRGSTAWGTMGYDLTRVICGEVADGQGNTVAAGDRWVREQSRTLTDVATTGASTTITSPGGTFTTADVASFVSAPGVPAGATITSVTNANTAVMSAAATATGSGVSAQIHTDSIRTPASSNVESGDMANRCGYFSAVGYSTYISSNLASVVPTSFRMLTPFDGSQPAGWGTRWSIRLLIATVNTVPGNYSTGLVYGYVTNLDTGSQSATLSSITINAAGVVNMGYGCTLAVSDPSGIMAPAQTLFIRAFSTAWLWGVDWWPMLCRAGGTPTFSAPPPGAQGTDWDIVDVTTAFGPYSGDNMVSRGNMLQGLAIKTATGLGNGARYVVSFPLALGKCRIGYGASAGILALDVGGVRKDVVAASVSNNGGLRATYWMRPFTTPGSVTSASAAEYFMSVNASGIVLALNGDPGATGKLATGYYCAYTAADPVYDRLPMVFNVGYIDATSGDSTSPTAAMVSTQYPYWPTRRRLDATVSAVRDWQTGWMRAEPYYNDGTANFGGSVQYDVTGLPGTALGNNNAPMYLTSAGVQSDGMNGVNAVVPLTQAKPGPDGKWWLYPAALAEGGWAYSNTVSELRVMRGILDRFGFCPDGGWSSGDELNDTDAGIRYLLVKPDYPALGAPRLRSLSGGLYGGTAIREV